jgi:hypothetical protein
MIIIDDLIPKGQGMAMANAWAVIKGGSILINTVHETRRGSIVNYLLTCASVFVTKHMSDEEIEKYWGLKAKADEVCTTVMVTQMPQPAKVISLKEKRRGRK